MRYPRDGNRTSGRPFNLAAPVRGLKTDSSLLGLSEEYALRLDNLICQPDALVTRPGSISWATGLTGVAPCFLQYQGGSTKQLFLADSVGVFNVTAAGAVGTNLAARTAGRGRSVNFSTSAGSFLYYVNGVDTPLLYDGSVWTSITGASSPAITGPTTTTLVDVAAYRRRLFFLATNRLSFYYMPVDSVGGAAAEFRIGSLCSRGGVAMGHATWTIDGGAGQDDLYVVATSEGEVVVFSGGDPATPSDWAVRGVFHIGRPVSRDCFVKLGGDLLYLSEAGIFPMSKALLSASINRARTLTANIDPSVVSAVRNFGESDGWQMLVLPRWSLILLNVPDSPAFQYVFNTLSGGWSVFRGWNAKAFADFNGSVFYTDGDSVFKAFTGPADVGANIPWTCDFAYNRFGGLNQQHPLMLRPLLAQNTPSEYSIGFAQDFTDEYLSQTVPATTGVAGVWDTGLWDTSLWGGGFRLQRDWRTVAARGGVAQSLRFSGASAYGSTLIFGADLKLSQQGLIV
jgi:hypothetical protein